tara:strand:- start:180 stop:470 length:291 start_codon:yes stop_codon:yes gene_type:complete
MKVGDLVQWTNAESRYAKWFYSQLGVIESINNGHCRVKWCFPVKYYDSWTTSSDFGLSNFSKPNEPGQQSHEEEQQTEEDSTAVITKLDSSCSFSA